MRDRRAAVRRVLEELGRGPLEGTANAIFKVLGYTSGKSIALDGSFQDFAARLPVAAALVDRAAAKIGDWREVRFLFQLTDDELPMLATGGSQVDLFGETYRASLIESFVFLAIELEPGDWTRTALAGITREVNRVFPMPVIILFRHDGLVSLAVVDRRVNKRDRNRDVIEKRISIIKDIACTQPHRAHVEILSSMALDAVKVGPRGRAPTTMVELHVAWLHALSVKELNERFYKELASWFYWAADQVTFPTAAAVAEQKTEAEKQNQIALIRLLTRLIFVWFIKERGLVPSALFEEETLASLLRDNPAGAPSDDSYYKAILQNLFFATLNAEDPAKRRFRNKGKSGLDGQYGVHSVYRYEDRFKDADQALALFRRVPFLNGGLFECLDREVLEGDENRLDLIRFSRSEGQQRWLRIDGFSDRSDNPLHVPNEVFFGEKLKGADIDKALNEVFQTRNKRYEVDGLLTIFSRYKFTVEENTPDDEEVALDPELLGKVFENLLASYNEDTSTTARKKSGSFYTPREVVDFMVDEALLLHFRRKLGEANPEQRTKMPSSVHVQFLDLGTAPGELDLVAAAPSQSASESKKKQTSSELEDRIRRLLSRRDGGGNPFSQSETKTLIAAIDTLRVLDPACGSGAFPMGMLQKLVHVLGKLDPNNSLWKQRNYDQASAIDDPDSREEALARLERDFSSANKVEYARKLYLIQNCLFGCDIQPIAVQIAKLRFFISLVISQTVDESKPNWNIIALPNLETKLVAADSLIPVEREKQGELFDNKEVGKLQARLAAANKRYFTARSLATKRNRQVDIATLRADLGKALQKSSSLKEADAVRMAAWDQFDQNSAADFFDPEWMFGADRLFDIVIANPPYVRQEKINTPDQPNRKRELAKHYATAVSMADLLVYFMERGVQLLEPGGAFSYITSNKWFRAAYGTNLQGWMNRNTRFHRIVDFGDAEVFDALAYPTIITATKRTKAVQQGSNAERFEVFNWSDAPEGALTEDMPGLFDSLAFVMSQADLNPQIDLSTNAKGQKGGGWQLEPALKRRLLERIKAAGTPLGEFVQGRFYRGVLTGLNEAFVIDGARRKELIAADPGCAEIIKPFLRGRDIKRWQVEWQDLWLIFTKHGIEIESYPSVLTHLSTYRNSLEPKPRDWDDIKNGKWPGRKAGSYRWYEIQDNIAYWQQFEQPKIIVPAISSMSNSASDLSGFYCNNKATIFVTERWAQAVSAVNSQVGDWFAAQTFATKQGGFFDFEPRYSSSYPIPRMTMEQQAICEQLCLAIQNEGPSTLQLLLNGLIYELFFSEDLHAHGLHLFNETIASGFMKIEGITGEQMSRTTADFTRTHLTPGAVLFSKLLDLQTLDAVRIIEGNS